MGAEAMAADSWLYLLEGLDGSSPAGPAVCRTLCFGVCVIQL